MRIILSLLSLAVSTAILAKPILTATCDVPVGNRYDQISGTIKERHDDFTDVHPVFVLDDQKPDKLLLIFGPTKPAQDFGFPTKAEEAQIVSASKDKVSAILLGDTPAAPVEMFTIYPTRGVMFYTKHGGGSAVDPFTATFQAKCKFSQ